MTYQAGQVVGPSSKSFGVQASTSTGIPAAFPVDRYSRVALIFAKSLTHPPFMAVSKIPHLSLVDSVFKRKKISRMLSNKHVLLPAVCAGCEPSNGALPWDLEARRKAECFLVIKYTQQDPSSLMTS